MTHARERAFDLVEGLDTHHRSMMFAVIAGTLEAVTALHKGRDYKGFIGILNIDPPALEICNGFKSQASLNICLCSGRWVSPTPGNSRSD